jgi:hypothetical protein
MKELRHPQVRDIHRGERLPNDKIPYGTVRSDHGCVKRKGKKLENNFQGILTGWPVHRRPSGNSQRKCAAKGATVAKTAVGC